MIKRSFLESLIGKDGQEASRLIEAEGHNARGYVEGSYLPAVAMFNTVNFFYDLKDKVVDARPGDPVEMDDWSGG